MIDTAGGGGDALAGAGAGAEAAGSVTDGGGGVPRRARSMIPRSNVVAASAPTMTSIIGLDFGATGCASEGCGYEFRFKTLQVSGKDDVSSFLYNNGQVTSLTDANLLVRQTYDVTRIKGDDVRKIGADQPAVPANIGPLAG